MDIEIKECTRNNLCVDCDDKKCSRKGDIEQDCPKYRCDNKNRHDCNNCQFMRQYVTDMRKKYAKYQQTKKG